MPSHEWHLGILPTGVRQNRQQTQATQNSTEGLLATDSVVHLNQPLTEVSDAGDHKCAVK